MSLTLSREACGLRPPTKVYDRRIQPVEYVYLHHLAARAVGSLADVDQDGAPDAEEALWRGAQAFHMDTKGWTDLAYSMGVGLSGWGYEGRGWDRESGGTGYPEDRVSVSICALGNFEVQSPTQALLFGIAGVIIDGIAGNHVRRDFKLRGDRDVNQTACPGSALYEQIPTIEYLVRVGIENRRKVVVETGQIPTTADVPGPVAWRPPTPSKPELPEIGSAVLYEGDPRNELPWRRERVYAMQRALAYLGYGVTGVGPWGPKTSMAVMRFQANSSLQVDGLVGPLTWEALGKALA